MTLQAGQLFIPGSPLELRDDLLADFRLEAIKYSVTQPAVTPGTDNWFFFTAVANAGYLQYSNIATVRPAITPLNATGEDLENWRIALGLPIVRPSSAAGKLTVTITGGSTVTFPDGLQFLYPSGLRGQVSGTQMGILDEQDVDVIAVDTGAATNLDSGTAVRWVGAPFNVANAARVSVNGPLTGGTDTETEDRKRERVLNRLRNTPAGGNWGHLREIAFNALASVQQPYVYPGLGGPSSDKVTILKAFDRTRNDYHRAFQSGAVSIVRNAIQSEFSTGDEHVVGTVDEQPLDLTFLLTLPASSLAGGSGLGWVDQRPWPPASSGPRVRITSTSSSTAITTNAATSIAPIVGQTHIMWWSPFAMKMTTALVVGVSGTSGAWTLTLDRPLVDALGNVASIDDYISPAAANGEQYGNTFISLMEVLGPGENTADTSRLPRSARHPFISDGAAIGITNQFLKGFLAEHSEIIDGSLLYVSSFNPTVPVLVSSNPMVLVPRQFGIQVAP
jgi:uncharacterized phage protein gp47/JayE